MPLRSFVAIRDRSNSGRASVAETLVGGLLHRLLTWRTAANGRVVLAAAVIGYLGLIAAGRLWWHGDLWPALGVPSGPSLFFDARNLTAAWECKRLGYDPLYDNPCDPWGRPLMYLRPWMLLTFLGLDQSHTFGLGVVLVIAMFGSLAFFVGRVPGEGGVVLALAACSPAIMLAVERANMDIALFSIVTAAMVVWQSRPRLGVWLSPIVVLIAATGKIYPVFALPAFLATGSTRAARMALLSLVLFAAYIGYSFRDVVHIAKIATQGEAFSYGARILPAHLYHVVGADRWGGPAAVKQLIAVVPLAILFIALVVHVRRRLGPLRDCREVVSRRLLALHVGTLIYLGTFASANNFDYRLVWLLLTLPQLIEWARTPNHRLASLASSTIVAILVLLWVGCLSEWLHLWDELASWLVASLLTALIAATLPPREYLRASVLEAFGRRRPAS
jgi:hypothetical protein